MNAACFESTLQLLIAKGTYLYRVPIPPPFVVIITLVVKAIESSLGCKPSNFATFDATFSEAGVISLPPTKY